MFVALDRLGVGTEWVRVMGASIGIGGLVVAPFTARIARGAGVGIALVVSGAVERAVRSVGGDRFRTAVLALLATEGTAVIVYEVMLVTCWSRCCNGRARSPYLVASTDCRTPRAPSPSSSVR
jgi:hypothetical protein